MATPKQELNCGICSNIFINPLMMPCLHSFCKKCLKQQLEEQGSSAGSIKCPTCDTVCTLSNGGVSSLPNNHWLAYQVEVSTYQQKIEDGCNISCERCTKKTSGVAVVFCCNCCLLLCSTCQEAHESWRELASHELIGIGEKRANSKTLSFPRKPIMCMKHSKEELKFYCDTCQCLVCRDCITVEHSDHKRNYIKDVAESGKEALLESINLAETAVVKLEAAIANREEMKKRIKIQTDEVNEKITQEFREMHIALQEREKALHSKCEQFANQKLTVLSTEIKEVENLKKSLTFSIQCASEIKNCSPAELLSIKNSIQEHLQDRLTTFDQLDLEPGENDDISVVVEKNAMEEVTEKFGNVSMPFDPDMSMVEEGLVIPLATVGKKREVKVAFKDSNGELVHEKVHVTARLEAYESEVPVDIHFKDNSHASISFQPTIVGEHRLTVKVKSRQIAGSPYTIWSRQKPIRKTISCKQTFTTDGNSEGVAVHHNGDIFASSSNGCIQVFNSDGSQTLPIDHGSEDGQLNHPFGLTIVDKVLYVVDSGNHRVQKFTLDGEYLGQFGSKGSSVNQFSNPHGICTDGKGHVLVADYGSKRVQVFTTDGILILFHRFLLVVISHLIWQ